MTGDFPLAVYSFEHAAIQERRLRALVRHGEDPTAPDVTTALNFGGHRYRVTTGHLLYRDTLTNAQAADAGFVPGDGLDERGKLERWARQADLPNVVWYVTLEPLERESNESLRRPALTSLQPTET